jgi:uncharacterized protein (DUF2062 family)
MWNDMVVPQWLISVVVLGLIGVIVFLVLWLRRSGQAAQQRAYSGLKIHTTPEPGTVPVVFHTYYGFVVFVIQTEHRFWASPEDARVALWRLHRFNLVWGMFAYGALVIPLMSFGNYHAQKRSIGRQAARLPV